jgi:hypothetical protein
MQLRSQAVSDRRISLEDRRVTPVLVYGARGDSTGASECVRSLIELKP